VPYRTATDLTSNPASTYAEITRYLFRLTLPRTVFVFTGSPLCPSSLRLTRENFAARPTDRLPRSRLASSEYQSPPNRPRCCHAPTPPPGLSSGDTAPAENRTIPGACRFRPAPQSRSRAG